MYVLTAKNEDEKFVVLKAAEDEGLLQQFVDGHMVDEEWKNHMFTDFAIQSCGMVGYVEQETCDPTNRMELERIVSDRCRKFDVSASKVLAMEHLVQVLDRISQKNITINVKL